MLRYPLKNIYISRTTLLLIALLCACLAVFATLRRSSSSRASLVQVIWLFGDAFFPQKNLSVQEGENWYSENKEKLMEIHKLIRENPAIQMVNPALSIQYIENSKKFSPETMSVYKRLENECLSLGIKRISIFRDTNGLISIGYTLSSSGLGGISGGKTLSIKYVPNKSLIPKLYAEPENIVEPLDEENWYIIDYREGRKEK
jgi:hypothetical protein